MNQLIGTWKESTVLLHVTVVGIRYVNENDRRPVDAWIQLNVGVHHANEGWRTSEFS
jgi:hypothetical protein